MSNYYLLNNQRNLLQRNHEYYKTKTCTCGPIPHFPLNIFQAFFQGNKIEHSVVKMTDAFGEGTEAQLEYSNYKGTSPWLWHNLN